MDTKPTPDARVPMPGVRLGGKAGRINRWLAVSVAVLVVAVVALGVALVRESGSEEEAPTRPAAEPTAAPGAESRTAVTSSVAALLASLDRADPRLVSHVDGGISALRNGDQERHFACGGYDCSGTLSATFYRYDQARGWSVSRDVFALVGTQDVERTSRVVLVGGTLESGSWTVAFSVRAGADEQLWFQHWEAPWGLWLRQMWVI